MSESNVRKVYMFEDRDLKYKWFLDILQCANELAKSRNLGVILSPGFGADAGPAMLRSMESTAVKEALEDDRGLYLVDQQLLPVTYKRPDGESVTNYPQAIIDLFKSAPALSAMAATVAWYSEIAKQGGSSAATVGKHAPSAYILHYLTSLGKPAIFVSTDTVGAEALEFVNLGIARPNAINYPYLERADYKEKEIDRTLGSWAKKILDLLDPLDQLKSRTKDWFRFDFDHGWTSFAESGLPHTADWQRMNSTEYAAVVQSAFTWLPGSWLTNAVHATALHHCLKGTVGYHAEWMGEDPKYALPLGGAYLIFLTAFFHLFPDDRVKEFLNVEWSGFLVNGKPTPFLPDQEQQDAERCIRALFDFFLAILLLEDEDKRPAGQPGVAKIELPSKESPYFRLLLRWTSTQRKRCAESLRTAVTEAFSKQPDGSLKDKVTLSRGTSIGVFLRFLVCSQVCKDGIGSKGTICVDDEGWLQVGV